MTKKCKICGKVFKKPYTLSYKAWEDRKYCSFECYMLYDNPSKREGATERKSKLMKGLYKEGLQAGFKLLKKVSTKKKPIKDKCEDCGSTKSLKIHHVDGNQSNHLTTNLETLCSSCHIYKHYQPYMFAFVNFSFASAHNLPNVEVCSREHGHNYKLVVKIGGRLNKQCMVRNFKEIKAIVQEEVISKIDHENLNKVMSHMPTAEVTCSWIFKKLNDKLKGLKSIIIAETDGCSIELTDKQFIDMCAE